MTIKTISLPYRIIRKIFIFIGSFIIVPIILFVKLFVNYKIGLIYSDRLGHLALNTDLFFRRLQLGLISSNYSYYLVAPGLLSEKVANGYLLKMFKRFAKTQPSIHIITNTVLYFLLVNLKNTLKKNNILQELEYHSNEVEFSKTKQSISFTKRELDYGYSEIKRLGMHDGKQRVVCIYARDGAYLEKIDENKNWKYHDYRNMDVNTYIKSIKYLISKGYKVIRVGSVVNQAVSFSEKNFYDYSLSGNRSEFLDLFLISISDFVVGSSSGATDIAELFKVPFLAVNFAPCIGSPLGKNDLYIPKKYIDINDKDKVIPFKKVIKWVDSNHMYQGDWLEKNYGLAYLDNTPDEILDAVIEMERRVRGEFVETNADKQLQQKYFEEFWKYNPKAKVKTNVCLKWLRENQSLYF